MTCAAGTLLKSDVALLRAATGVNFTWPPDEVTGAPQAAFDLALLRVRQASDGTPWRKLTPADVQDLHRMGILGQEVLDKALQYLSQTHPNDSGSSNTPGPPDAKPGSASTSPGRTPVTALYL